MFHFGFIDGLYIKYGGKKYDNIDLSVLKWEHNFLIVFELIISIVVFILSIFFKSITLLLFSISILPIMVQAFHKYINQATGRFNVYSKIMYLYTFSYLILNVILTLLLKNTNYVYYCIVIYLSNIISVLYFEMNFLKQIRGVKEKRDYSNILNCIKVGIFVLLGNLVVVGLFGIDKWFIKLFYSTEDFAYYSFAVSLLNLINVLVNAISITFYNYLFENNNVEKIFKLKRIITIIGCGASTVFFVFSFIVSNYIKKYIASLEIISITFAVFPYMIMINALFVNLYKVNKDEKHYFRVVFAMLLVSIFYNIIAMLVFHNIIYIAYATLLTLITWVVFSIYDLKNVKGDIKTKVYLITLTTSFLIISHKLSWLIGGIVYFAIYVVLTMVLHRDIIKSIFIIFKDIFRKKIRRED